jgi:hypothetical protein
MRGLFICRPEAASIQVRACTGCARAASIARAPPVGNHGIHTPARVPEQTDPSGAIVIRWPMASSAIRSDRRGGCRRRIRAGRGPRGVPVSLAIPALMPLPAAVPAQDPAASPRARAACLCLREGR